MAALVGPQLPALRGRLEAVVAAGVSGDLLLADPGFDWAAMPDWAVWRFEECRPLAADADVFAGGNDQSSGLATLIGAAAFVPMADECHLGEEIHDVAEELFVSFLESLEGAADAAAVFERLRRDNGYRIDEPVGERLSTFAAGQVASLALLAAARLPGFADVLRRAERDGPNAPDYPARLLRARRLREEERSREEERRTDAGSETAIDTDEPPRPPLGTLLRNLVLPDRLSLEATWSWFVRPDLGIDALNAAFFALQGIVPETLADYEPCELAAGYAHLRQMAYAIVAIEADRLGLEPDRADPAAGPARCHGLAPLVGLGDGDRLLDVLRGEPDGLMAIIAERRQAAGLASKDIEVAIEMRARQGLRSLPAFGQELGDIAEARARAFKQARARRILAEREAAGYVPSPPIVVPDVMPDLGSPLDEAVLRLVPEAECVPKLKPHPNPRSAFQLEEPPFVTRARLERERLAAAPGEVPAVVVDGAGALRGG